MPSNIALLKDAAGFSKEFNVLRRSFILEHGSIFNYSLYLEASSEGDNPIKQGFSYTIKGINDKVENDTFVNPLEPKPIINFTAEYAELLPEQKYVVIAILKNPSKVHELTEIKAKLNAPYSNEIEQSLNKLMPNESYQIISNTLIAPKSSELGVEAGNKTINLTLNVEYKFYGVAKSLNKFLELKIKQEQAKNVATTINETKVANETKANETVAESQSGNKTNEQVTTMPVKPKPKFNKKNIFVGASIFITILLVTVVVIKIRKRKKGAEETMRITEDKQNQNIFKPNI